jgi:peptidoglycan/xylan/chitin deacetylase (PgdA/CDA1 family)
MRNFIVLFVLLYFVVPTSAKEVAISFDDAPRRLTGHYSGMGRAKALVKKLKSVGVNDAVFFCNSSHINEKTKGILKYYNDHGYVIANHTDSHLSLNDVSFKEYSEDFLKADKILSKYSNFSKMFRFPYLREGSAVGNRDNMRELLSKNGYKNAYITVDFSDWHLESLFRNSITKKDKVNLNKLRDLYISLAKESLDHYDSMAKKYLGRSPKHILLLHETDIAALFIGDLVKAMRSWGWTIISSKDAYTDKLYDFKIKRTLKNNPGRVGELAIDKGHPMSDVWARSAYTKYISDRYKKEVLSK